MSDKATWRMGTARVTGGGLDGLMILGALERIEQKLDILIQRKKRNRSGPSDPGAPTEAQL